MAPAASATPAASAAPTTNEIPGAAPPPCNREDAPVTLVADVETATLPRVGAVDGGPGGVARLPVFHGSLYQHGVLLTGKHDSLRVPSTALVAEGARRGVIEVYVAKSLGFKGHPPQPMTVASVRRNLGLATSKDGATLVLATYGEFGTMEGGAGIHLFLRVPQGFPVQVREGLAGESSEAVRWPEDEASYAASQVGRVGYWYAAVNPRKGWTRVTLGDDARRVARQAGTYPEAPPPCAG